MVTKTKAPTAPAVELDATAGDQVGQAGQAGADSLQAEADAIDRGLAPTAAAAASVEPADTGPDFQAEAREAVNVVAALLKPAASLFEVGARLADCYGEPELDKLSTALGNWCEARGVSLGDWFGRWMPELMLAGAALGPAVPVLVDLAKSRADKGRRQVAAPAAPGQASEPAPAPAMGMSQLPDDLTGGPDGIH